MAYDFVRNSSQYLSASSSPLTNGPLTVALWMTAKQDDMSLATFTLQTSTNQERIQVSHNGVTSPKRPAQFIIANSSDNIFGGVFEGSISTNVYAHQVGTMNAAISGSVSATFRAWFNGVVGHIQQSNTLGWANSINEILIGIARMADGGFAGNYHNGLAAEAAVWNVALSDAEVVSLSKGFKPYRIRPQSLVFYAPLIRELHDVRGGRNLTNNNSATVANHPRVY
jgi:hypothetical protein